MLIHHGVTGGLLPGVDHQPLVQLRGRRDDPVRRRPSAVLARTSSPLLTAETRRNGAASCRTSSFPPPSRRSTASCSCSTAWPIPASVSPSSTGTSEDFVSDPATRAGGRHAALALTLACAGWSCRPGRRGARRRGRPRAPPDQPGPSGLPHRAGRGPDTAAHTSYRLDADPTVGVLWVYADASPTTARSTESAAAATTPPPTPTPRAPTTPTTSPGPPSCTCGSGRPPVTTRKSRPTSNSAAWPTCRR